MFSLSERKLQEWRFAEKATHKEENYCLQK